MRIPAFVLLALLCAVRPAAYGDEAHGDAESSVATPPPACAPDEEVTSGALRLGILDFSCTGEAKLAEWLGVAMAEALYTRLAGVPDVVLLERQRVAELTAQASGQQLAGMGCDVLITGTVQVLPEGKTTRLRVNIKLLGARTGLLHGAESLVIDGELSELFTLQRLAAGELADALTLRAADTELSRLNGTNLAAEELFALGTGQLMRAVRAATAEQDMEDTRQSLRRAIDLLRRAQQANTGYFVRAHTLETDARELLARLSPEDAATIRADTVNALQNDAQAAAPAFFNLGRAMQANADYTTAIGAYGDFLAWMNEQQRLLAWRNESDTEFSLVFAYHESERQITCCPAGNAVHLCGEVGVIFGWLDREMNDGALFGLDLSDGRTLWQAPMPKESHKEFYRLLLGRQAVYAVSNHGRVMGINPADGTVFAQVRLPLYTPTTEDYSRLQIGMCDDPGRTLIIRRVFRVQRENELHYVEEIHALAPDSLHKLWSRKHSGEFANAFWLLEGKVILQRKQDGQTSYLQFEAASGQATATPLPDELLAKLGFSHSDIGEIFTTVNGARYLVTGKEKDTFSAKLYRIAADWQSFESCEDFSGAFMRNWYGTCLVPYTRAESTGEMRLLCRNHADGIAQIINVPQNLVRRIVQKENKFDSNYAFNPPYLTAVRDGRAYEVYRLHDGEISLHWRHTFTSWGHDRGWGITAPQAANQSLYALSYNSIRRGGAVTRYNIPATIGQLSEAETLLRIGQCHASLGQNDNARDFLGQALDRDMNLAEAHYGMARLLLQEGQTIDAWRHAENFARFTHRDDPRREELWQEIVRANRILWRGSDSSNTGTRIIDSLRSIVYFTTGRLHLSALAPGSKPYTEEGERFPPDTAILAEHDGVITVHAADYKNVSRTRVFRYDTAARKVVQSVDYPNTRHVRREGWVHDHAMRLVYDERPALLHDEGRPETFLLVDVANPQEHRRIRLNNAISPYLTNDHRFKSYRENALGFCFEIPVSGVIYEDMVVIGGFAEDESRHAYVLAGYSRKEDRVIWEHLIPMSAQARQRIFSHHRRLHLLPLGNRFLLHAYKDSQWHIFDLRTGFLNSQHMPGDTAWPFALPALAGHALLFDENAYIDPTLYALAVNSDYADLGGTLQPQGLLLRHNLSQGQHYALFDPQTRQAVHEGSWCFPRALYVHPEFLLGHIHINPDDGYSVIFSAQTLLPPAMRRRESRLLLTGHEDYRPRFDTTAADAPQNPDDPEDEQ